MLATRLGPNAQLPFDPVDAVSEAVAGHHEVIEFGTLHVAILGNYAAPKRQGEAHRCRAGCAAFVQIPMVAAG